MIKQVGSAAATSAGTAGSQLLLDHMFPTPESPSQESSRPRDENPPGGSANICNINHVPMGSTKGYPSPLGANDIIGRPTTNIDTGVNEPGIPGTVIDVSSAPNEAPNMEHQQTQPDLFRDVHTVKFVESGRTPNVRLDSRAAINYEVETLKTWLNREHKIATVTAATNSITFDTDLVRRIARGRLNHFTWFRGDPTYIFRWNAPKNVYGAFFAGVALSTFGPTGIVAASPTNNMMLYKSLIDIQDNVAELRAPFLYMKSYLNLFDNVTVSRLHVRSPSGTAPRSTSDSAWTFSVDVYMRFDNVSLLTPTVYPQPQGIIASKLVGGIVAGSIMQRGQRPTYCPNGQDVIRTFSEGINLCRADGADPAMPMNREVCEIKPMNHPLGFTSFKDLAQIPYYIDIGPLITTARVTMFEVHSWAERLRDSVAHMRCDFTVTLHCFATGFHSGRVRIIYNSTGADVSLPTDDLMLSWSPSILWNIEENKTITFELPYGAAREYDTFPQFWLVVDRPFSNSFGEVAPPLFAATVSVTNLATIGFGSKTTLNTGGFAADSDLAQPITTSDELAVVPQGGFNLPGWYNQQHTSENEYNYCLATLFRRPSQGSLTCTGETLVNVEGLYYTTGAARIGRFIGFGGRIMQGFSGWRGTVKISVSTTEENKFTLDMYYRNFTNDVSGTIISSEGFTEVSIPYCTPHLFYINRAVAAMELLEAPRLRITPKVRDSPYSIFISFMDDLELIGPRQPIRATDFESD